MLVLLSNVGSTSLKYRLLEMEGEQTLARGASSAWAASVVLSATRPQASRPWLASCP